MTFFLVTKEKGNSYDLPHATAMMHINIEKSGFDMTSILNKSKGISSVVTLVEQIKRSFLS